MPAQQSPNRPLSVVASEISGSLTMLLRSEAHLMQAEVKEATSLLAAYGFRILISLVTILLGAMPLVAFLVMGIARLLNNNYILSSFIVGITLLLIGVAGASRAIRQLKEEDLSFPLVRESLSNQKNILNRKLHEIYEVIERRGS